MKRLITTLFAFIFLILSFKSFAQHYEKPEWYGAVADGNRDCTAALQSAINNAIARQVPVLLSFGTYKITSSLICSANVAAFPDATAVGVEMIGRGRKSSVIKLVANNTTDALVFHSDTPYGRYGSLRNLRITGSDSLSRDLLTFNNWSEFIMENVQVDYAGRHCMQVIGQQYFTARDCFFQIAGASAVIIGGYINEDYLGTTARFYNCLFDQAQEWGCQIRSRATNTEFYSCYFQSSGFDSASVGGGLELWDGNVLLMSPGFEDNVGYDAHFGSQGTTQFAARAVIIQPFLAGPRDNSPESGGFFFQRVANSVVEGGYYGASIITPIVLDTEADVKLIAYPDSAEAPAPVTADRTTVSNRSFEGTAGQARRFYASKLWSPGSIPAKSTATTTIAIQFQGACGEEYQYPQLGDVVNIGYNSGNPDLLISGYVSVACSRMGNCPSGSVTDALVTVSLYNTTDNPIQPSSTTLNVEVIRF